MAQPTDYLAAERTFLAWLRTGLALMGFGFVVARFGLFLKQIQFVDHAPALPSTGISQWFGTALIVAGIVVTILSCIRHVRMIRDLESGKTDSVRSVTHIVAASAFMALVGIAMAIYLISIGASSGFPH
jgi:putative membrane protein